MYLCHLYSVLHTLFPSMVGPRFESIPDPHIRELHYPIFIVLGIVGGALGGVLVKIYEAWHAFQKRTGTRERFVRARRFEVRT